MSPQTQPTDTTSQAPAQVDVLVRLKKLIERGALDHDGAEPQLLRGLRAAVHEIEAAREVLATIPVLAKQFTDLPEHKSWGPAYNTRLRGWLVKAKRITKGF